MRILTQNTAGILIDVQERLFPVMHEKEAFLTRCIQLIKGMQILDLPLLVTQQYTQGLGNTIPELAALLENSGFIEKRDFSCCGSDEFNEALQKTQARNIVLMGIESHVCVLQTALDLKEGGYNPIIVMDAVSSRFPANFEWARERYRFEGIMMTSTESLLFELTHSSASPQFKAISQLVK